MKQYYYMLALALSLLSMTANGQREYLYTANLTAFAGTWEYRNGTETFILELKVGFRDLSNHFFGDYLIGDYIHSKGGRYHRYTDNIPSYIGDDNFSIPSCPGFIGANGCTRPDCVTPNEIRFYFWDRDYGNRELKGFLTLLSPTTVRFEVWEQEGYVGIPTGEITVPNNVTLTKQAPAPPPPPPPSEPGTPPALPGFDPSSARQTVPDSHETTWSNMNCKFFFVAEI